MNPLHLFKYAHSVTVSIPPQVARTNHHVVVGIFMLNREFLCFRVKGLHRIQNGAWQQGNFLSELLILRELIVVIHKAEHDHIQEHEERIEGVLFRAGCDAVIYNFG
ncbi:hypothetical protein D3C85_1389770 [compost metagenome]